MSGPRAGAAVARTCVAAGDVPALYEGAGFYSPAVNDMSATSLLSWAVDLLDRNGPVPLVPPGAMAAQTRCAAVCVIGSGAALADLPPTGDEFVRAVGELEQLIGGRCGALYPLAAATVSALAPLVAASQLGLPLLDADGMGQAFALIHHTSMHLAGLDLTPLTVQGVTGETVSIKAVAGARADTLLRSTVETLGGWAALAAYPATAGRLQQAALPGTVSRLIEVGRVLRRPGDPDALADRLAAVTGCRPIGRGRIVELEHLSRPRDITIPAHASTVVIDEIGGRGRLLRLELRSGIVAVLADGVLVAAAPDLICLVDILRGELSTLDSLEPGDLVDVLVTPADAVWYSGDALALVGPASHGIRLDHPRRR